MAFFDDFSAGITGYPAASVTLTITPPVVQPPGTVGAVNVNEVWSFRVTVTNNGSLNMTNVVVHFAGLNGAGAATTAAGPFSNGVFLSAPTIASVPAGSSVNTATLFFKAPPGSTAAAVDLVEAHLNAWDADLDNLLNNVSGHANPPVKRFSSQVFP